VGFSASSDTSNLAALYDKAFDNARVAAERVTFPVRLAEKDAIEAKFESPLRVNPFEVPLSEKVSFLQQMDREMDKAGVTQRISTLSFTRKHLFFLDSEAVRSKIDHGCFR